MATINNLTQNVFDNESTAMSAKYAARTLVVFKTSPKTGKCTSYNLSGIKIRKETPAACLRAFLRAFLQVNAEYLEYAQIEEVKAANNRKANPFATIWQATKVGLTDAQGRITNIGFQVEEGFKNLGESLKPKTSAKIMQKNSTKIDWTKRDNIEALDIYIKSVQAYVRFVENVGNALKFEIKADKPAQVATDTQQPTDRAGKRAASKAAKVEAVAMVATA